MKVTLSEYLMSNIHKQVINRLVASSFSSFLIRRISYNCIKLHVVVFISLPIRLSFSDFCDKLIGALVYLFHKVFK